MRGTVKWSLDPTWEAVDRTREAVEVFFRETGFTDDAVFARTMVVSELVENSVKYGDFTDPAARIELAVSVTEGEVTVEVSHPTPPAELPHLERLDRMIQYIRGFQDPFEAYVEQLKQVARRSLDDSESGLGLARMAYEGKALLDFFVEADGVLNLSAVVAAPEER